jgi:hypothetical protein
MGDDFQAGDVVVAVSHDICPLHADRADDAPEMIGRIYRISATVPATLDGCIGGARLEGRPDLRCVGTLRKLPKADDRFAEQMRALKPHRVREPA